MPQLLKAVMTVTNTCWSCTEILFMTYFGLKQVQAIAKYSGVFLEYLTVAMLIDAFMLAYLLIIYVT